MADSATSWLSPNNKRTLGKMDVFVCLRNFTRWLLGLAWLAETVRNGKGVCRTGELEWRTDRCDFKNRDTTDPSQTKRHPLGEQSRAWWCRAEFHDGCGKGAAGGQLINLQRDNDRERQKEWALHCRKWGFTLINSFLKFDKLPSQQLLLFRNKY